MQPLTQSHKCSRNPRFYAPALTPCLGKHQSATQLFPRRVFLWTTLKRVICCKVLYQRTMYPLRLVHVHPWCFNCDSISVPEGGTEAFSSSLPQHLCMSLYHRNMCTLRHTSTEILRIGGTADCLEVDMTSCGLSLCDTARNASLRTTELKWNGACILSCFEASNCTTA